MAVRWTNFARFLFTIIAVAGLPHLSARAANVYQFGDSFGTTLSVVGGSAAGGGFEVDAIGGRLDRRFTFVSGTGEVRSDYDEVLMQDTSPFSIALDHLVFDADDSTDEDSVTPNGLGGWT